MEINCNGGCGGCDCVECPDCPDDGTGTPDLPENLCDSLANILEDQHFYTFSQIGITGKSWKNFYLGSGAINEFDTDFDNTFHGLGTTVDVPTQEEFSNGSFLIRILDSSDSDAIEITEWQYDMSLCPAGGFLRDYTEVYCFGYNYENNAIDNGEETTFLQWQLCPESADDVDILNFCWFGEEYGNFIQLRNECSSKVVQRVFGDIDHNPLWAGQDKDCGCYPRHYDLALSEPVDCINQYQFDECLFTSTDTTPLP